MAGQAPRFLESEFLVGANARKVDSDITTANLTNNIRTKANIIDVYSKTESDKLSQYRGLATVMAVVTV